MSFRTGYSASSQTKDLDIPDHVPVGAVIGKGGSYCKALRENHGVRCNVKGAERKVTLKGSRDGVSGAEEELAELFASFSLEKPRDVRVFEVVVRDGSSRWWSFEEEKNVSSDPQVEEYRYRLQQSGRAVETASQSESWVKEFREEDMADAMSYLQEKPSELPPKVKLAFGKLCFKLKSIRCENPTIAWPELQNLRNFDDFMTRWSNFCGRTSPSIAALMDDLEEWMEEGVEPRKSLSVHLAGYEGKSYDLKYRLVGGQWQLHNAYTRRHVLGTYDVILDNDSSFRVRAVTREKVSQNKAADIQSHVAISIPASGNFFHTEVSLVQSAPSEMHLKSFDAKSKVQVEANGLRFSISYLDERQTEFRLECRLATAEKEKLDAQVNEAKVLMERVLQVLS